MEKSTCTHDECGRPVQARKLCRTHYSYWQREHQRKRKTCAGCAEYFFTARTDVRFCSPDCHNRSQARGGRRSRSREAQRANGKRGSVRWRALRRARQAATGSTGGGLVWVQGACVLCETAFLSPGEGSRYCSRACRAIDRSRRMYGLRYTERLTIYERDGWTCQICKEAVDPKAGHRSDWYPTLDHIIPRSKGGTNHLDNLRTAHRWCNSVRGDLSHYTDADLARAFA